MIKKEILAEINQWWDDKDFRYPVRDRVSYTANFQILQKDKNFKSIDILIGARRVGKTSLLRSVVNHLLTEQVHPNNILYFTSDSILSTEHSLDEIVRYFLESISEKKTSIRYILLDEVQDLKNWAVTVKYFYDNFNCKFILTGSSSLILHKETSKLTGRFKLFEVLGLDFKEYLEFTNQRRFKSIKKNNILLEKYFYSGGYPEYVLTNDSIKLDNAIDATLYRDLLSLYGIRNPKILSLLLDYLADKITTPVSPTRIAKDLKITDETAKFYLQYLQDVYLIYPVYKYGYSNKITKSSLPKYYFADTGVLNNRSINKKIGLFAENSVYLQLRRLSSKKEFADIYYFDEGQEVDFYLPKSKEYIEVKFKDEILEEEILKYVKINNLSIYAKNIQGIHSRQAYPEIQYKNIVDLFIQ